jgi:hypothetical protein
LLVNPVNAILSYRLLGLKKDQKGIRRKKMCMPIEFWIKKEKQ